MDRWHSTVVRVTGVAVGLAVLAACGSGSEATDSDGPKTGTSTSTTKVSGLLKDGEISFCTDPTAPPMEFLDANQKYVGAEIELGEALAGSMGLEARWVNTAFNGIIPALQAKQCDAILTNLYIKPEREEIVDFVPYLYSANTVMVKEGSGISGIDALCGKKAAAQTGTTAAEYFKEANAKCSGDKIDVRLFTKDTDALQQLKLGLVDAYGTTLESAAYAIKQQPGKFEMAGEPFGKIECGIATRKDAKGVHDALGAALKDVQADGTYDKILAEWNLTGDALKG
jgi:polar amino acid transport system substrate-binding protein